MCDYRVDEGFDNCFMPGCWRSNGGESWGPGGFLLSSSYGTDELSIEWNMSSVVPLFKRGSHDKPGNHRPVSFTSVVRNVFGEKKWTFGKARKSGLASQAL